MNKLLRAIIAMLVVTFSSVTMAESQLELGAGIFTAQLPHYPGANQHKTYILPTAYVYYTSDKFTIDRNQFTGFMWNVGNWHLDLSAGAGISINSDDNSAREDMPDIDWVFELGPSLKYFIAGTPKSTNRWFAELFARKAIATDFSSIDSIGWRYGPSMSYQHQIYSQNQHQVNLSLRANVNFSDTKYLDYYYGVAPQYQTTNRQTYTTPSGYAGSDVSLGLTYKSPKYWVGGFVRYYGLNNAKQQNSPLFFEQDSWAAGVGFVWIFYRKTNSQ